MTTLLISPHDPFIARDGRPFGQGEGTNRLYCLDWPYPPVIAGSVRTLLGKRSIEKSGGSFDDPLLRRLKAVSVSGPLPFAENRLYFPAPLDLCIASTDSGRKNIVLRPRPLEPGEGCNTPFPKEQGCNTPFPKELGLIDFPEEGVKKPEPVPPFWSSEIMAQWLCGDDETLRRLSIPARGVNGNGFLNPFPKEERVHVSIDPTTFIAAESKLFSTEALCISSEGAFPYDRARTVPGTRFAVCVKTGDKELSEFLEKLDALHPCGGERRLARFKAQSKTDLWACPPSVAQALSQTRGLRMVLATPGPFKQGWLPGWLDQKTLVGNPGGFPAKLKLRGACIDRWQALSGFSLEKGSRGPKPIRRLVPAGSVYFFEISECKEPNRLADGWLQSVCDEETDRWDGLGLALWGTWDPIKFSTERGST